MLRKAKPGFFVRESSSSPKGAKFLKPTIRAALFTRERFGKGGGCREQIV
jgi:hypothetical protein